MFLHCSIMENKFTFIIREPRGTAVVGIAPWAGGSGTTGGIVEPGHREKR